MEHTDRELLEKTFEFARENNRMLHAQRRAAFIGGIIRLIVWLGLLVILPYYLYTLYIQPYLPALQNAYATAKGASDTAQSIQLPAIPPSLIDLFNQLKAKAGK